MQRHNPMFYAKKPLFWSSFFLYPIDIPMTSCYITSKLNYSHKNYSEVKQYGAEYRDTPKDIPGLWRGL